jgi:sarcosine oxidase/L-pipecolate oxidase
MFILGSLLIRLEISCSSSEQGIAGLRKSRQDLIKAKSETEKTNVWLENEAEIVAKMPAFTPEQVKVT